MKAKLNLDFPHRSDVAPQAGHRGAGASGMSHISHPPRPLAGGKKQRIANSFPLGESSCMLLHEGNSFPYSTREGAIDWRGTIIRDSMMPDLPWLDKDRVAIKIGKENYHVNSTNSETHQSQTNA
jgi:hypothetical protein